jgi:peptide/nickel transport system substrate-binding protein
VFPFKKPFTAAKAAASLSAVLLLAACSGAGSAGEGTVEYGEPVLGGTLTYLEYQAPTCLYLPAGGFYPNGGLLNQLTDKLTYQNPETLAIEPWIAESWEVNADATEYIFKLREGVTFSDGTALDAAAVAKNFDTYGLGNKDLKLPVAEQINNYKSSEVLDPLTVKFNFTQPSPGFLQGTSVIGSGLVSPATLALPYEEQCQLKNIVGSGPFTVENQVIDKQIDLKAREDYNWAPPSFEHQGRAYLDKVEIVVTPEDSVRIGSLTSGQADYVRYVQAFDEAAVEGAGFELYAPQTRGVNNALNLHPDNPLLGDINVRRALLHGVNAQEVVDTIFTANYPKATSVLSSTALGYKDLSDKLNYDPELSKKLLDDAGWVPGADGIREKDGLRLSLDVYISTAQPLSKETLELVSQQLKEIGATLNIKPQDSGSYTTDIKDASKTAIFHSMVGRADQDVIKSQYHTKNRNVLVSSDAELDKLLEDVASEPDTDKRNENVAEAQEYLIDQAYVIPLFEEPQVYGAAPYVQGIKFEAVGRPSFYDVWLLAENQ